jgi:hypothetical protein
MRLLAGARAPDARVVVICNGEAALQGLERSLCNDSAKDS